VLNLFDFMLVRINYCSCQPNMILKKILVFSYYEAKLFYCCFCKLQFDTLTTINKNFLVSEWQTIISFTSTLLRMVINFYYIRSSWLLMNFIFEWQMLVVIFVSKKFNPWPRHPPNSMLLSQNHLTIRELIIE
jgi:hypothetical protein